MSTMTMPSREVQSSIGSGAHRDCTWDRDRPETYRAFNNDPINCVDPTGLEGGYPYSDVSVGEELPRIIPETPPKGISRTDAAHLADVLRTRSLVAKERALNYGINSDGMPTMSRVEAFNSPARKALTAAALHQVDLFLAYYALGGKDYEILTLPTVTTAHPTVAARSTTAAQDAVDAIDPNINCMQWATRGHKEPTTVAAFNKGLITKKEAMLDSADIAKRPDLMNKVLDQQFSNDPFMDAQPWRLDVPAPDGRYKIAAYVYLNVGTGLYDFHFITQHADGSWSGKAGSRPVVTTTPDAQEGLLASAFGPKTFVGVWIVKGEPRTK